jgi:small subunit ribosomal protein S6
MSFYENTLVTKQDLPKSELNKIREKYTEVINQNNGKVIKIEEWGLLNLSRKIKKYNNAFYSHYKFEGNKQTLSEINKKVKIDGSVIRHLIVKYKILDTKIVYFKKDNDNEKKK